MRALPDAEAEQLCPVIAQYVRLFATNNFDLGTTTVVTHSIKTGDHAPIHQQPRDGGWNAKEGVIQLSRSPWASPIVLVAKKDRNTHLCVDCRKLNAVTNIDIFPLPLIDDSLDLLATTLQHLT